MQHSNIQKRHFTLVELMVAMGVLVIMMGFLFQFTIGAQRIWNASSKQTTAFSSAQVLMDVLTDNLQNMRYSIEDGERLPFYLRKDGDDVIMAFYTDFTSGYGVRHGSAPNACISQMGTFLVLYFYDSTTHKVHYCRFDGNNAYFDNGQSVSSTGSVSFFNVRLTGSDYFDSFKLSMTSGKGLGVLDTLVENVTKFDIKVFFGTDEDEEAVEANKSFDPSSNTPSKRYAMKKPVSIKISFELDSDLNAKAGEETKYSFSKVLFL